MQKRKTIVLKNIGMMFPCHVDANCYHKTLNPKHAFMEGFKSLTRLIHLILVHSLLQTPNVCQANVYAFYESMFTPFLKTFTPLRTCTLLLFEDLWHLVEPRDLSFINKLIGIVPKNVLQKVAYPNVQIITPPLLSLFFALFGILMYVSLY